MKHTRYAFRTILSSAFLFFFSALQLQAANIIDEEVLGTFTWIVRDEHIQRQPYQMAFRVRDEFGENAFPKALFISYNESAVSISKRAVWSIS